VEKEISSLKSFNQFWAYFSKTQFD